MPRAALSEDEIEAFRRKAIRVATRLFADQGYEAVTLRAIADALGTSAMAPYRYFENKAEIFAMVRVEATRVWLDSQCAALETDQPLLQRLFAARDAYVKFALENADLYRIIFDQHDEPDGKYPALDAMNLRAREHMHELGRLAVEAGIYAGDAITAAHMMWANVHGLISLHLSGKLRAGRTLEELLNGTRAPALKGTRQLGDGKALKAAKPKRTKPTMPTKPTKPTNKRR